MAPGSDSPGRLTKTWVALFPPSTLALCFLGQWLLSAGNLWWGVASYALGAVFFGLGVGRLGRQLTPSGPEGAKKYPHSLGILALLALWSGAFLFYRLDSFPDALYNWEVYTVQGLLEYMGRPFDFLKDTYLWNESLMTDSDRSLLVGGPTLAALQFFGVGLFQLRIVPALYGVLSIVLFYKLAEEHFGRPLAIISAIALATSPVFLLYSRTATNVGPSIFASLLVVYLFAGAASGKRLYFPLLGIALGIASYYYAVIRFIPASVLGIAVILLLMRKVSLKENGWALLLMVALLLATVSPQLLDLKNLRDRYFGARGEHAVTMWDQPGFAQPFVQADEADPSQFSPRLRALASLVTQNATDYVSLYLSVNRSPVLFDYWNPRGGIIPPFLAPFLVLGVFYSLRHLRKGRYFLLIFWFLVTSLPMLLTNNVHAGRLILSVPPMFIMTGLGLAVTYFYWQRIPRIGLVASRIGLGAFLLLVVVNGARDYFRFEERSQTHAKRIADFLGQRGNQGDAYVFTTLSGLEAAELNFYTYYDYNFGYYYDKYGENFAAASPQVPGRKSLHFYNVSQYAPGARLEKLREIVAQRKAAYLITDSEVYPLAKGDLSATMRLEQETGFLYFFSSAAKGL